MSDQCHAPQYGQGKAARKIAVAHLALARSQNTGAGVSGIHKKQSSRSRLLLWCKYRVEVKALQTVLKVPFTVPMRKTFNPVFFIFNMNVVTGGMENI